MAEQKENDDNYSRITVICDGLSKYYRSYGWEYDKIFCNFINESEMGEPEDFDEMYEQDMDTLTDDRPTEANMIDFALDDNKNYDFPFPKKQQLSKKKQQLSKKEQAEYILKIIIQCDGNPDVAFSSNVSLPTIDKNFFVISQEEFDIVKRMYLDQTPVLYNGAFGKDLLFLQMLTVCHKAPCNYLQLVVDDYLRSRVEQFIKDKTKWNLKIEDWVNNHKHFKKLEQIKLPPMPKFDEEEDKKKKDKEKEKKLENAALFVQKAVHLYQHRIFPNLSFKPIYLINESIETVVNYIYAGYKCVGNIVFEADHLKRPALPIQFDLCIITDPAKHTSQDEKEENQDEDDDDDDVDDEKEKESEQKGINPAGVDCIGDIEQKLNKNNLEYFTDTVNIKQKEIKENSRIFTTLLNKMEFKNNPKGEAKKPYFLHKKRFIGFVDRRKKKEIDPKKNEIDQKQQEIDQKDPIYLYLPPEGPYTRDIPENAIPEWYIASSRTTLLPNLSFNIHEAIQSDDSNTNNQSNQTQEDKLKNANINSQSSCFGSLLILSFHVRTNEDMSVYLYYDGKMTRFLASDISTLLPTLFNPDYRENDQGPSNADFLQTEDFEDMIKELNSIIKDVNFVAFRQRNQKKSD